MGMFLFIVAVVLILLHASDHFVANREVGSFESRENHGSRMARMVRVNDLKRPVQALHTQQLVEVKV